MDNALAQRMETDSLLPSKQLTHVNSLYFSRRGVKRLVDKRPRTGSETPKGSDVRNPTPLCVKLSLPKVSDAVFSDLR